MGRRKIEIKAIKDDRNRSVTFLKRKGGLFKKAHELSVLCSVDVAVFIFGSNKKLYEYSSSDMRDLITKYQYHGGPSEHKGPHDFNGGDDDEDEDGENTPPHGHEGSVEPQMIPPHFQGQPPYTHLRHHTPSASPPINGMPFAPRGHTPQPQMASRPSSRNDFRRDLRVPQQGAQQVTNGYAYMPQPAIYNPQSQPSYGHNLPPAAPAQYQYASAQQQAQVQNYMEEQRRSSVPPNYPPQGQQPPRPSPPQPTHQMPPQQNPHMSPPQPPSQHLEPPQLSQPAPEPPQPPTLMEPKHEHQFQGRPGQPLLDTASAIKKMPPRKGHSIFTPIDGDRSILGQHLASFDAEPRAKDEANRSQSVDVGAVSRTKSDSSPPLPQRSNTSNLSNSRNSIPTIPETTFTPPSRSNSLKVGGGARPRLKVQIPEEQSEAGSTAGDTATSPRTTTDTATQGSRRNGVEGPGTGVVLPPPSPSASAMLSAGATGPPNPFARPPPQTQNNNMNIDTPVSALPSRFLNNEFLPSPSSFYPEWNFRGSDSNTLPSPINFATPSVATGPLFLRDEPNVNKRKSPDITAGHGSDGPEGGEPKRIRVDG
ncbi:hypothetical protein M426DRAFT_142933 [Hypoxylon sp. CI-4A]|nr:hypothetical protein M426DRAFT_142933 [Hypoxylon sp. CI-4A]